MRVEGGGFAASLDADSEGEEGRFYTWNRSEIADVLGNDPDVSFLVTGSPHPIAGRETRLSIASPGQGQATS